MPWCASGVKDRMLLKSRLRSSTVRLSESPKQSLNRPSRMSFRPLASNAERPRGTTTSRSVNTRGAWVARSMRSRRSMSILNINWLCLSPTTTLSSRIAACAKDCYSLSRPTALARRKFGNPIPQLWLPASPTTFGQWTNYSAFASHQSTCGRFEPPCSLKGTLPLIENTMCRYKTIFDDHLTARKIDTQATQFGVRCGVLNRMTALGMPDSYRIA